MKKYIAPLFFLLFISCHQDKPKNITKTNNSYYDQAWSFSDRNMPDSSFIYFNKAQEEFLKNKDSIGVAKCLVNMAIISSDQGDYFGSQEISLSAVKYLHSQNKIQKEISSSNYNNLGKTAHLLKKYEEANQFYIKAIQLSDNETSRNIYFNNIAINLTKQKKYEEALKYFEQLMRNKDIRGNKITFARILSNIAKTKWLKNPRYDAKPEFLIALNIRKEEDDLWGQNASYSHLTDYYTKKKPDAALFYAQQMYRIARQVKSPDDQLEALQKLIKLSPPTQAKPYFESYQNLSDSVQTARSAAKNQFALIRYETEKSKADNLILQKDNTDKKYEILLKNILLFTAFLCLVSGIFFYKKRKKMLLQEKELEIKNTELKYVKKIHDRLANKVYHVMSEVENTPQMDKNTLLDKLEVIYDISRNISYEIKDLNPEENFANQLATMLKSYASDSIEIFIIGNEEELWEGIKNTSKIEIFYIMQELMTNMKKHSMAETVVMKFRSGDRLNILYSDNGIGLKNSVQKNGLQNMVNRIESIFGTITFDKTQGKGLSVTISCPFS